MSKIYAYKFEILLWNILPRHRNATLHRARFFFAMFYRGIGMHTHQAKRIYLTIKRLWK
jgi:hypothetical protein